MIYATLQQFKQAIPTHIINAAGYDDDTGVLDDARVQASIDEAIAEINGYLAKPYDLPFTATSNKTLEGICIDIAVYKLARSYDALTEDIRKRYEDRLTYLSKVMEGKAYLPAPLYLDETSGGDSETTISNNRGKPNIQSNPRLFTRDSLKEY